MPLQGYTWALLHKSTLSLGWLHFSFLEIPLLDGSKSNPSLFFPQICNLFLQIVQEEISKIHCVIYPCENHSCPTLGYPVDHTVHGILQARILEWVAFPFSRDLPNPGIKPVCLLCFLHWQAGSLPLQPPGKPPSSHRNPQYKRIVLFFPFRNRVLVLYILGCTHFLAIFDLDMSNKADEFQGWSQIWLQLHQRCVPFCLCPTKDAPANPPSIQPCLHCRSVKMWFKWKGLYYCENCHRMIHKLSRKRKK